MASSWGSVTAEGLSPTSDYLRDADDYVKGHIDADEIVRRAIHRHNPHPDGTSKESSTAGASSGHAQA